MQTRIPATALALLEQLTASGYEAYLVGGCVRDLLRGETPSDYDMTTSATPEEMLSVFSGYRVIETGLRHGTLTVLSGGVPYEITTYRIDGEYTDSRHPDSVTFTRSLTEDLARRDFTVNAMAYSPTLGLCDPFGGQDDLRSELLRAVGDPHRRFTEDALRIFRAIRFSSSLGFRIDPETEAAALALRARLVDISPERIRVELVKLLLGRDAARVLGAYREILVAAVPALAALGENFGKAIGLAERLPRNPSLRLIGLLSPLAEAETEAALLSLRFDKRTVRRVAAAVGAAREALPRDDAEMLRFLGDWGECCLRDRLAIAYARAEDSADEAETRFARLLSERVPYTVGMLEIGGDELLSVGFPPGKAIGAMLGELLNEIIHGNIKNTKNELLSYARRRRNDVKAQNG